MHHKTSLSFATLTKIILSGAMPKCVKEGAKMVCEELIQSDTPPFRISDDKIPLMNPAVAAPSSGPVQMNSCIAPTGNVALGKEYLIGPRPVSTAPMPRECLNPCKGRSSFWSSKIISAFVFVITTENLP